MNSNLKMQNSLLKIISDAVKIGRKNEVGLGGIVEICNGEKHKWNAQLEALPRNVYVSPGYLERFKKGILEAMEKAKMPPELFTPIQNDINKAFENSTTTGDLVINLQKPMEQYFSKLAQLLGEQSYHKAMEQAKEVIQTAKVEKHDVHTIAMSLYHTVKDIPNTVQPSDDHRVFQSKAVLGRDQKSDNDSTPQDTTVDSGPKVPKQPQSKPLDPKELKSIRLKKRAKQAIQEKLQEAFDKDTSEKVALGIDQASQAASKNVADEYLATFIQTYIPPKINKPSLGQDDKNKGGSQGQDGNNKGGSEEDHSVTVSDAQWDRIKSKVVSIEDNHIEELKSALIAAVNDSPDSGLQEFVTSKMRDLSDTTAFVSLPADIKQFNDNRYKQFAELVNVAKQAAELYNSASRDRNNDNFKTTALINYFPHTLANLLYRLQSNTGNNYFFR